MDRVLRRGRSEEGVHSRRPCRHDLHQLRGRQPRRLLGTRRHDRVFGNRRNHRADARARQRRRAKAADDARLGEGRAGTRLAGLPAQRQGRALHDPVRGRGGQRPAGSARSRNLHQHGHRPRRKSASLREHGTHRLWRGQYVAREWLRRRSACGNRESCPGSGSRRYESVRRRRFWRVAGWHAGLHLRRRHGSTDARVGRSTGSRGTCGYAGRAFVYMRLSPDGRYIALDARDEENDIWIWDFGERC